MQINNKINKNLINFLKLQIDMGIEFSSLNCIVNKNIKNEDDYSIFDKINKIEELDFYLKNVLENEKNDLILSMGNMSSKILLVVDNPDHAFQGSKTPFSKSSLILLTKMFEAINVSLAEIIVISIHFPNYIMERKSLFNNLTNFDLIVSRFIKIINPLFLVNMCINNNFKLSNLETKPEKFDISNPSLIMSNPNLKKKAWEELKLLKRKIHENTF